MNSFRIDATELAGLARRLDRAGPIATAEAAKFTRQKAIDIETTAKQLVPVRRGDLKRSIHHEMSRSGLRASIGSDLPYARRIELGFTGADSLGRVYDQPPKPYLGPAHDRHAPEYVDGLGRIAASSISGRR